MKKKFLLVSSIVLATALTVSYVTFGQNLDYLKMSDPLIEKQRRELKRSEEEKRLKLEMEAIERAKDYKDSDRPKFDEKTLEEMRNLTGFKNYRIEKIEYPSAQIPLSGTTLRKYDFTTIGATPFNLITTGSTREDANVGVIVNIYSNPQTNEDKTYFYEIPGTGKITLVSISEDKKALSFKTEKGQMGTFDVSKKEGEYTIK
mgnify:CR=1 FL=1